MTSTENETETATNTGVEETDEFDEEYEYEDEEYEDEECTEIYHPVPTATRIYVTYEESIDPNEEEEEEEGLTYEDALDQLRELKYPKTRAGPSYVQVPRSNIAVKVYERERFLKLNETTYDINSPHKDQIYHISLNETGDRMALCGGDQTVSVWNRNEDGTWKKVAFWKTHGGAIWRIVWAHPDFGQILATCSFDRNINIFKEDIMEDPEYLKYAYAIRQRRMDKDAVYKQIGKKIDQTRGKLLDEKFDRCWVKIAALRDSRENITDVQFGPRTIGLCLAAVSAAGNLRVYEVPDQRELKHWDLVHETQVIPARLSCVAWSRSKIHRPNVFMGSDEPDSESFYPRVIVYECNEVLREWRRLSSIQFGIAEPVTDIQISPCYRFDGFQFAVAAGDIHVYDFIVS
ncbi:hypothetical protein WR25_16036 isoform A [Diploscapter pachys]|uniref:Uncharacterized protein n=2 Tax=Diploscapter pachys TaxID=2018661 RepID=A0A2A2JAH1_9BILA|nr:hypothetical protein WR25_16036 isoform A [Diploscapter pachys]